MKKSKASQVANILRSMSYSELEAMAEDLADMQADAKEDGWRWKPSKAMEYFFE